MMRRVTTILSICMLLGSCAPGQPDPCTAKVSSFVATEGESSGSLVSPYGASFLLGGLIFYNDTTSTNATGSMPSHARSAWFWFTKKPDQSVHFVALVKKGYLSEVNHKDFLLAVAVGDGFAFLPALSQSTQAAESAISVASSWSQNARDSIKNDYFQFIRDTESDLAITDPAGWCSNQAAQGTTRCNSPFDTSIFRGQIDLNTFRVASLLRDTGLEANLQSVEAIKARADGFLAHQNAMLQASSVTAENQQKALKLLTLRKALYEVENRIKPLTTAASPQRLVFLGAPDSAAVVNIAKDQVPMRGWDCQFKKASELVTTLENAIASPTLLAKYCLEEESATTSVEISLSRNHANLAGKTGLDLLLAFSRLERQAISDQLLQQLGPLLALGAPSYEMHAGIFAAGGSSAGDRLQGLKFLSILLDPNATAAPGKATLDDELLGTLQRVTINSGSGGGKHVALEFDESNASDLNFREHFQIAPALSLGGLIPLQILATRDEVGESGGLSYRRLPATKSKGESASTPQEADAPPTEETGAQEEQLDTSAKCQ